MFTNKHLGFFCFLILFFAISCKTNYTPKRSGYFRLDFPKERNFVTYNSASCPFIFEYADFGQIEYDSNDLKEEHEHPCWFNINYKDYNAKIYLSYTEISSSNTLDNLIKDSYKLTFKHTIRADYIDETIVKGKHPNVSGMIYDVGGNAASGVQFYITDSTKNFLRGSLYFNVAPNIDSIAPAIQYFRNDVVHIINSLSWK
ncbi:MAG TPA: gliding motility lipoprotein GldD [Chitinophagales bacterium]|nr:gliding motility lipoprotein GldD [Chitinophagales bacterium]HMU98430.1 gliding motility lipoprotein GldD [Chitinophagales bacterium]HMV03022.1 gliding motility lipoprotein GldD [Chitinophagales bacterium]HMW95027.1 gliding motility lipoprotein GldD [Chitinophagales bacterium]HMY42278.1 gliding motility lipoprotein GldD [Chitinophagales bacterium]